MHPSNIAFANCVAFGQQQMYERRTLWHSRFKRRQNPPRMDVSVLRLTVAAGVLGFTVRPHLWGEMRHLTRRDELGACGDLAASFYAPRCPRHRPHNQPGGKNPFKSSGNLTHISSPFIREVRLYCRILRSALRARSATATWRFFWSDLMSVRSAAAESFAPLRVRHSRAA